jgi:CHAT domain-containing protein/tetratricopeptide (TPR) repeat protein
VPSKIFIAIQRRKDINILNFYRLGLFVLCFLLSPFTTVLAQSPELMEAYRLGMSLYKKGMYDEAIPFYQTALKFGKQEYGLNHITTATLIHNLANLYFLKGHYAAAEPLFKQAQIIKDKVVGPDHPSMALTLGSLGGLYYRQGQNAKAERFLNRSLAIKEIALGPEHSDLAITLGDLGVLYIAQGRYAAAEKVLKRSLVIKEKTLGLEDPEVALSLGNLASLMFLYQGRYTAAEPLLMRSLAINEKVLGPMHPGVAISLNNLGELYKTQGRYAEAVSQFIRALEIFEKSLGQEHPNVAISLGSLASLYILEGRYAVAEPFLKRSLAIGEKTLGAEHPDLATTLNDLALLYKFQSRFEMAVPLIKRSLTIKEKALGPDHPDIAGVLNNLALIYYSQGEFAAIEPLLMRSLDIIKKALGARHPSMVPSLNNLSQEYRRQERHRDAESLAMLSLRINEEAFGAEHPQVVPILNNLALLYKFQGDYAAATSFYKRALAITKKMLGLNHPLAALIFNNFAGLYAAQGKEENALEFYRRATAIHRDRITFGSRNGGRSIGALSEQKSKRSVFISHIATSASVAKKEPSQRVTLTAEAFSVGQLARTTQAGAAVSRMAARFAAGNDDLAKTVREFQDANAHWQKLDTDLIKVVSAPPAKRKPAREKLLRKQLSDVDARIVSLKNKLATKFPAYAELAVSKPVSIEEVQKLLGPNEALIAYLVSDKKTYVWAVRSNRSEMFVVGVGQKSLGNAVKELRRGLDATNVAQLSDIPEFNRTVAHRLFKQLFAPAEQVLKGASHVFVVADGALQSLPLGVLVTDEPQGEFKDFSGYRQVPWLAKKYALTTLPSVSSLRTLRRFAKRAKAHTPFVGFGDPVLKGHPGSTRGVKLASLYRGGIANVNEVRNLESLPHTADELRALSAAVKGDSKHIYLRKAATEKAVKSLDLSNSRIVAFATHGLITGELKNTEPALVLTPPEKGTALDDGLLTASEVAQLKLNADLVILSACNTAAGDGTAGAEGLSGLAKAFFYAGSRALLVSHWLVESGAAVKLTTGMLDYRAKNPTAGRAKALQNSMLTLMNNPDNPYYAHPIFWAPFVVVGEGGTYQTKK